jgi:pyruvate kinase
MNIARFNLSHGKLSEHARFIRLVRHLNRRPQDNVAVLLDLPGPKYRIGNLKNGQITLKRGDRLRLTTRHIEGDATRLPVNLPNLAQDVRIGDTVLLADGALELRVEALDGAEVTCRVIVGGRLTPGRGLVVPGRHTSGPFLTDSLRKNLLFAIRQRPDYLAVSFVTSAQDIVDVRGVLNDSHASVPIIAKIERGQAVNHFDEILAASDGIMVARGDLGVDIPLKRIPLVQKEIIRKCNLAGKPVIVATEMLESMVRSNRPTRAETTDVANAIFDGADATMLSAETSVGKYPVAAVRMMAKIACETEKNLPYDTLLVKRSNHLEQRAEELISYDACHTAHRLKAVAIVAYTRSGNTATRVSKYRPKVPILALTPRGAVCGRLSLYWGVHPLKMNGISSVAALFTAGANLARDLGLGRAGDMVVITGGIPLGETGSTNLLKVETIGA